MASLFLRKLSQSTSNIPPPHIIDKLLNLVERFLPMPSLNTKDAQDSNNGAYARTAHTLNNLMFALAFVIYLLVIIFSFVF